jgi:acylphosphatase
LSDGRVEAVFEGEDRSVKELVEFCRRGPHGAKVANVDVLWEDFTGEFASFRTRYEYDF